MLNMTADALFSNQQLLCSILEYHIVPYVQTSFSVSETAISVATLLTGYNLTLQRIKWVVLCCAYVGGVGEAAGESVMKQTLCASQQYEVWTIHHIREAVTSTSVDRRKSLSDYALLLLPPTAPLCTSTVSPRSLFPTSLPALPSCTSSTGCVSDCTKYMTYMPSSVSKPGHSISSGARSCIPLSVLRLRCFCSSAQP